MRLIRAITICHNNLRGMIREVACVVNESPPMLIKVAAISSSRNEFKILMENTLHPFALSKMF